MDAPYALFGLKYIGVRRANDPKEIPIVAAQGATFEDKLDIVELYGDDAVAPLDTQVKRQTVSVKGTFGEGTADAINALVGGSLVTYSPGQITGVQEENGGSSMKNAIQTPVVLDASAMLTEGWNFVAVSPSTYEIEKSQDATKQGPYPVSAYPNTSAIPGVSFVVSGILTVGSWASFQTVGPLGSVGINDKDSNDYPSQLTLRMITEAPPDRAALEILLYRAQPMGTTFDQKTREFGYPSFEFRGLFNPAVQRIYTARKYDRPLF